MSENPDWRDHHADKAFLDTQSGTLRFIERNQERILQRYEWSGQLVKYDWFDVPLGTE
jgi:hypothetical protein